MLIEDTKIGVKTDEILESKKSRAKLPPGQSAPMQRRRSISKADIATFKADLGPIKEGLSSIAEVNPNQSYLGGTLN